MSKLAFPPTQEQISKLPDILDEMLLADLAPDFAEKVIALAAECQGVFELAEMWREHHHQPLEREKDMESIVELLWDHEQWVS
jgi:hypothetical protein